MKRPVASLGALVAGLLALAVSGGRGRVDTPLPATERGSARGALVAAESAEPGRTLAAGVAPTARIERALDELRTLAGEEGFHALAWPRVQELQLTGFAGLLEAVAGDAREHERVRGACLLASGARHLAENAHPELERAAWLACGLRAPGTGGTRVPLGGFASATGEVTFPAVIVGVASPADVERAVERVTRPIVETLPAVRAETFTREVVVLSVLGPGAGSPGRIQDWLLAWVGARRLPERLLRDVSLHVLALAAHDDEELARRLLEVARALGPADGGPEVVGKLVRVAGHEALGLEAVRELLADPVLRRDLWSLVQAVDTLGELLCAEDGDVQRGAAELAVEHLLDASRDSIQRSFFLDRLAAAGGDLVYEVSELVLTTEDDPEVHADLLPFLAAVTPEHRAAALGLVIAAYDVDGPRSVRQATIATAGKLGGAQAGAFLEQVAAVDPDADLRALADRLRR